MCVFFFFKQKTAYEMRISDWSSDVCSSDLVYSSFSEETVFSLLSAELAGQRNRLDIALDNYVTQAINTQDPGISERAFRIAEYLGADQPALDTVLIWAKNAPKDLEAQRDAAVQLTPAGRHGDTRPDSEEHLKGQAHTH